MRTLHLFAGAGGGLLADLILGHQPIAAVEFDVHCCRVLRQRAADGWFPGLHVHEIDIRLFDPSEYAGRVDCIHAGFPCTDISVAGKGAGIDGEASGLWREVARVAGIVRPRYLFLENSPAIISNGLGRVLGDLAALRYDARWRVLSAAGVGAPHERERWWCIAERADAHSINAQRIVARGIDSAQPLGQKQGPSGPLHVEHRRWWSAEPGLGRVAARVADTSHRLRAIGNGQVPLCAAAAWIALGGPVETMRAPT